MYYNLLIVFAIIVLFILVIISMTPSDTPCGYKSRFEQPVTPDRTAEMEVFLVNVDVSNSHAEKYAASIGAKLATYSQVKQAQLDGADFHTWGWTKPDSGSGPNFTTIPIGESRDPKLRGVLTRVSDNPDDRYGVYVFAMKPKPDAFKKCPGRRFCIDPWNDQKWSKNSVSK